MNLSDTVTLKKLPLLDEYLAMERGMRAHIICLVAAGGEAQAGFLIQKSLEFEKLTSYLTDEEFDSMSLEALAHYGYSAVNNIFVKHDTPQNIH